MADGSEPVRRERGRPSLFKPEYCDTVIELGKQGYSKARMAAHFDVAKQTIDQWAKDYPDFSDALTRARTLCQAHWEHRGYGGLENKNFNTPLYIGSMKSMFREDYMDRSSTEITGKDGEAIEVKDATADARRVAFMLGRAVGRAEIASKESTKQ